MCGCLRYLLIEKRILEKSISTLSLYLKVQPNISFTLLLLLILTLVFMFLFLSNLINFELVLIMS